MTDLQTISVVITATSVVIALSLHPEHQEHQPDPAGAALHADTQPVERQGVRRAVYGSNEPVGVEGPRRLLGARSRQFIH